MVYIFICNIYALISKALCTSSSAVAEQSTHDPKIKGLNPGTFSTGRDTTANFSKVRCSD